MTRDPVCEFYTHHPYPPPVDNLDRARDEWRDPLRARAEFHLFWPHQPYRADLDILVAGCGTWQAAKYAMCRPEARVTGIDVSPTSLEHTQQLRQKHRLDTLELQLLPIERASELGRTFDLIVCTGVLHHLEDPAAGLRALAAVMKPGGALYLMVYAPYGRAGIYLLQDYCRRLGIGTSREEIADLVATLEQLPRQHPLATLLGGARDARSPGALADALLNPRDRAYSVPQLRDLLREGGWHPERWYWQAPYLPHCGAIATTPHSARLQALPAGEQHAAMELWRGTMTTHSVVASHHAAAGAIDGIRFDDGRWLEYVPIRLPWTQLVQERLPPGVAGVLLNRSHQHTDLVLPVGADEKRMFDGIDGRRTIAEIARGSGVPGTGRADTFFETLWRYDQVVFNASTAR
jgi:SAM-dependent methyltransferase